ncbi:MAG: hypothetical protein QW507_02520 [Candidatus Nanoarchaeia archaeon]|nr:hypothetical protein [Candidatus Haiyanarchaeum thermophilum]MCW1303296.1 hypothetical protein [Candidatus Haiyanarchaeum thermophilum]MCW1303972.1 hypothetical protein [Candidatus Haiyanarchaeum thermophilum]MCW1306455.1 hypothetical protein [Candidatus Haiyanarchaeum thermophilum]MCW1307247.1 hypothetical protein [Candidatus Haiyanarchaeum thermophilum]
MALADAIPELYEALMKITPPNVDPVVFWLVFLILLAIFYTFLGNIEAFKKKRGARAIVALCLSILASLSIWSTTVISKLVPYTGIAAVLGVIILIIAGIFGLRGPTKWIALGLVLLVFALTAYTVVPTIVANAEKFGIPVTEKFPTLVTIETQDIALIIVLVILIVAAAWVIFGKEEGGK